MSDHPCSSSSLSSSSPAEAAAQAAAAAASKDVLGLLKTFLRGNTKEKTKTSCVIQRLLKIFRQHPTLINRRYKVKEGYYYTPLMFMCFLLNNNIVPLTTIRSLLEISPDPAATVSMHSKGSNITPISFACKHGRADLITLLTTTCPSLVTSELLETFFLLPNFPACSVEMLQKLLLDVNPTTTVSDEFAYRAIGHGSIPLPLLEKIIENCKEFRNHGDIVLPEDITKSLAKIQVFCNLLPKIPQGQSLIIETKSRVDLCQWNAESFLHLLQQIESNNNLKSFQIRVPDIMGSSDATIDTSNNSLIADGLIKMMTNNQFLITLSLFCSSDVVSTHFWLDAALKALPTASKNLKYVNVDNDTGFSVLIEAPVVAPSAAAGPTTICLPTSHTILSLPAKYLVSSPGNNNILVDFVNEKLPNMCSIQWLDIEVVSGGGGGGKERFCKETATRIVTNLLRNSPKLERIRLLDKPLRAQKTISIQIDLILIAKALEDNTSLRQFYWYCCHQKISQQELEALRNVLKTRNLTLMKFMIFLNSGNNLIDPQISYYVDLNWRGRSKVGQIINNNNNGSAIDDLIDILTSAENEAVTDETKKLGIWYGLLRETPAVWSSSNLSHGKDLKRSSNRNRKHGETV